MKLCASSEDCLEMVRFDGINEFGYPEWFDEFIKDGFVVNDFGSYIYYSEEGEYAICLGDVFLRNKTGDVKYMPVWMFTEKMYEVRGPFSPYERCCVKGDVLEWVTVGTNEVVIRNKKGFQRVITRTDFWRLFLEII